MLTRIENNSGRASYSYLYKHYVSDHITHTHIIFMSNQNHMEKMTYNLEEKNTKKWEAQSLFLSPHTLPTTRKGSYGNFRWGACTTGLLKQKLRVSICAIVCASTIFIGVYIYYAKNMKMWW